MTGGSSDKRIDAPAANPDAIRQIEAGREAWQRIREHGRKSFNDWITVARALAIGRSVALQEAGTDRPYGVTFTRASARWLREAGLDTVNEQERSRALLVLENLPAISIWRAGLDEAQRRQINHPNAIWAHWRRSIRPIPTTEPRPISGHFVPRIRHSKPKSIFWSQDAIKRAAVALRECYSNDTFVMARRALEAAIRTESDLLALLPADPPAKKPRQIAAPAALELQ